MKKINCGKSPAPETAQESLRDNTALIVLSEMLNQYITTEFENAVAQMAGLADLIKYHPGFQEEAEALQKIIDARDRLISTTWEAHKL